jgi:phage terminase small subunit
MAREKWPPPGDLDTETKREWRRVRDILVARGDLTADDDAALLALERLVHARMLLRACRVERADKVKAKGSMGQDVAHPLIAIEVKAEADIAAAMNDLLITPRSRKSDARDDAGAAAKAGGGRVARGSFG